MELLADEVEAAPVFERRMSERAAGSKRYLKSDLDFVGATLPDIRRVVKETLRANVYKA